MGRRTTRKQQATVTVAYDLFRLPTAQHKAGLAGLALQIDSMRQRGIAATTIPEVEDLTPTGARFRFSPASLQGLFDDLYDARVVEVASASRWSGKAPKREQVDEEVDPKTGKVKNTRRFVYDVVQPCGWFLRQHFPDENGLWLKLWREMLWAVPRSKPTTRAPFEQRAQGKPCAEAKAAWKELLSVEKARGKHSFRTTEVAGALLLGAQAVNAEAVPFRGRSEENLLLHFWQLTALTFVPEVFDQDGKREEVGHLLAIPEVADLGEFQRLFPNLLHQLDATMRGYRPAGAVIDLPAQGALEFLEHLARLAREVAEAKEWAYAVSAVEFFHMVKVKKNVKAAATGRVTPARPLLEAYRAIKNSYRNPLFRSALLVALLRGRPWYAEMPPMFAQRPWPFFIHTDDTPRTMPWFGPDAAAKFRAVETQHRHTLEAISMTPAGDARRAAARVAPLETIVYRLIQTYVRRKTEEKSGIRYEDFKDKKARDEKGNERLQVPPAYLEAREKLCADAFLALRSRREQDFVDYFTATVGSVGQFLPVEDYRVVAEALIGGGSPHGWEDVKTLAMLALSANYSPARQRKETTK
jgi:CRISPR-associated protein Cmx8